jgi:hypothetical protein
MQAAACRYIKTAARLWGDPPAVSIEARSAGLSAVRHTQRGPESSVAQLGDCVILRLLGSVVHVNGDRSRLGVVGSCGIGRGRTIAGLCVLGLRRALLGRRRAGAALRRA